MKETVAIIGAGNMGAAFYKGMREHLTRVRINVCDRNLEKLKAIDAEHIYTDPMKAIADASVVLLAVKPQSAAALLTPLSPALKDHLVISIMAGITLASLQNMTRSATVIRAMPNLPAQVGRGLTGWIASVDVSPKERAFVKDVFLAVGREIEVEQESLLDSLTPLSGSGPAYFFLLAEMIMTKALKEGFTPAQASLIARETLIWSAQILDDDARSPSELRAAVTSKGGTTQAALEVLKDRKIEEIFFEAIDRAIARSKELNQ